MTSSLKVRLEEIINSKKCMGLSMLANATDSSPLLVAETLDEEYALIISGTEFENVWNALSDMGKMTVIVANSGCIFEVSTSLSKGKNAQGYYNLFGGDQPLHGHIKSENITKIGFISIPFMGMESHCVSFFNEQKDIIFSVYVGRENHKLIEKEKEDFLKLKQEYKSHE